MTNQYTRSPIRANAAVDRHPKQIIKSIIAILHFGIGIITEFVDRFRDPQSLCVDIITDSAELVVFIMHLENMVSDPGDTIDDLHQQNQHRRQRQSDQRRHLPAHCSPPYGICCKYQWHQAHRSWSPDSPYQRF